MDNVQTHDIITLGPGELLEQHSKGEVRNDCMIIIIIIWHKHLDLSTLHVTASWRVRLATMTSVIDKDRVLVFNILIIYQVNDPGDYRVTAGVLVVECADVGRRKVGPDVAFHLLGILHGTHKWIWEIRILIYPNHQSKESGKLPDIVGQAQLCGSTEIGRRLWDSPFERLLGHRSREGDRGHFWYNFKGRWKLGLSHLVNRLWKKGRE
jgi:hypothetical protein